MLQIEIVGANEQHGGQFLAIDYVSFSKEPCKQIPWRQKGESQTRIMTYTVLHLQVNVQNKVKVNLTYPNTGEPFILFLNSCSI